MINIGELKDKYVEDTIESFDEKMESCREDYSHSIKPDTLDSYGRYYKVLQSIIEDVKSIQISMSMVSIKEHLESIYSKRREEYYNVLSDINNKYEALVQSKVDELEKNAAEHNAEILSEHKQANEIFILLEEKRKFLEQYSYTIVDVCSSYGITSSDISIDNSSFELEELGNIYDEYITYMTKNNNRQNIIKSIRKKVPNAYAQGAILLGIFLMAFTPALDFIALIVFAWIVYSQLNAKDVMKRYSVLMGLVFNVNPLAYGFKDSVESNLLKSETIDVDTDEAIQEYADMWECELQEAEKDNPDETYVALKLELVNDAPDYEEEFNEVIKTFEYEKNDFIRELEEELKRAHTEFEEKKSRVKLLGDEVALDYWLNTNFRLGIKDGVMEEFYDIGLQNIIVSPNAPEESINSFIQILYANIMCNVRPGQLYVDVFDPNRRGQTLINFYNTKIDSFLQFRTSDLKGIISEFQKESDTALKVMGNKSIQEYNKESQELNRSPRPYRLLIVLSQPKEIVEDEVIRNFLSYSAKLGLLIWAVADTTIPNVKKFNQPFDGVKNPYTFEIVELGQKVLKNFQYTLEKYKAPYLSWKEFTDIVIPGGEVWRTNADEYAKFYPGFVNGDPTDSPFFTLGNQGDVHGFIGGVTGAGKSGIINAMIDAICLMNSPDDLELWLIDLKGNEFTFYLPSKEHPYCLPHIAMCLCTSDPDYCGSVYAAIEEKTKDRFKFLADRGFKNLYDYNRACRAEGRIEDVLPRVVIINDEWQALFVNASADTQPIIKKAITEVSKKGRAAGIHFLPASQELSGTVPDNILAQFTLRFALRCDDNVSKSLLGNTLASKIKEKNGYCYVKAQGMQSEKEMPKIRIPFVRDDELRKDIKMLYEEAIKRNCKKKTLIAYNEEDVYTNKDLKKYYEDVIYPASPKSWPIILGERMTYDPMNLAPDNVALPRKNNAHISAVFSKEEDIVYFYKTIITNLQMHKEDKEIFINSQVEDLHYLCEVDLDLDPEFLPLSNYDYNIYALIEIFEGMYENRKATGNKDKPMYIILIGWDKARGFGIEKDMAFNQRFTTLLQVCGEYNMHFILLFSSCGMIASGILGACKVNIAGRCDENSSSFMIGKPIAFKVEKPEKGFMYRKTGNSYVRSKLYQYDITREVVPDEFVISAKGK